MSTRIEIDPEPTCWQKFTKKITFKCPQKKTKVKHYLFFNIVGIIICILISVIFVCCFIPVTNKTVTEYYDYYMSKIDKRSNALLTSVDIEAPEYIQTCFVTSEPETIQGPSEQFDLAKHFDEPVKTVFFKQQLLPKSNLTIQYLANSRITKQPLNVTMYLLKGTKQYQRFSLGLTTAPIYSIDNQSQVISDIIQITGDTDETVYFVVETYHPNVTMSIILDFSFRVYDMSSVEKIECKNGSLSHEFVTGESMIIYNQKSIFSKVIFHYKGSNVFVETILPLSLILFIFSIITFTVISNRKRRDDEIQFLKHSQFMQNQRTIQFDRDDSMLSGVSPHTGSLF